MLKKRLVPCILIRDDIVVQSFNFKKYLPIGKIDAAIEFFTNWDVDEIVILDITATPTGRTPNFEMIEKAARKCFVPLTIGGGIQNIKHIEHALSSGADKVCINTAARKDPDFVRSASERFGVQCITISVDAKKVAENKYNVFFASGTTDSEIEVVEYCKNMESIGAGEIFLNSIDRDGTQSGYDLNLINKVTKELKIPVVACGGAGVSGHFIDAVKEGNASAVSAANIFQHTELSTIASKAFMREHGINIRINSTVTYNGFKFDHLDRPI